MIKISGVHNTALCYTKKLEPTAEAQIRTVCNRAEFAGCKIRIMPDVHAGMGCTIGTTMTITDKIVPGMVGVDIGCGMETVKLAEREIDYDALDRLIRRQIPSGFNIRKDYHPLNDEIDLDALRCASDVNLERARRSIGTLGGGNHFIEVGQSDDGELYLVVHSGSRHIGSQVAEHYQDKAYRSLCNKAKGKGKREGKGEGEGEGNSKTDADAKTDAKTTAKTDAKTTAIPKELSYAEGELFDDYIHDMKIIQKFATLNRVAMTEIILRDMGLTEIERFTTIHNYIDTDSMILRKGAVSAKLGEQLLIPINMRDGSLICVGRGNDDWNQSAPHGAGRLMSRKAALKALSMDEYVAEMSGIFTTSVTRATLDESPMAYKPIDEILSQINPTAEIVGRIKPTYNFKASE